MNKPMFITIWILVFLLQHMVVLGGRATRCYRYSNLEFMVFPTDPGYLVFTEDEYDQLSITFDDIADAGGYWVRAYPKRSTGPIPGVLEWYYTTSYMPDPSSVRITSLDSFDVSREERELIHTAVVDHAWTIPELAELQPGEAAISTFEAGMLSESLASVFLHCTIPTVLAWICTSINWSLILGSSVSRTPEGHCVHCGYDCRSLPGSICPECGQDHAQPLSA